MNKIISESQLYVKLARRGDPSAFYALFHEHIRNLYLLLRSQGKDHGETSSSAVQTVTLMYRKFVNRRIGNPQKWFAAGCRLKRFDPAVSGALVTKAEVTDYERQLRTNLHRVYSARLDRGSDDHGNLTGERSLYHYVIGLLLAFCAVGLLFFAETVFTVRFGRFDKVYNLSFPQMAKGLWDMSGLVRSVDPDPGHGNRAAPAKPDEAEHPGGP